MRAYERLLDYVTFDTQSDEKSSACPSTPGQLVLAGHLAEELKKIGAEEVSLDEYGYLYATVPASSGASGKVLSFCSHMDTAEEMSGKDVKARIIKNYGGEDLSLNENCVTDVKSFPLLSECIGDDLIVTDGTTLLGADDKAGIAVLMTACEDWIRDNHAKVHDPLLFHPRIRILFTPDEEIGCGPDHADLKKLGASYGFTLDGTGIDHLQYENFNAAAGSVEIRGNAVHPGSAFGIMKNASLIAMEFHSLLPALETPAATKDRMGFFHLTKMEGSVEKASMQYLLRDHDRRILERRKEIFTKAAEHLNLEYGKGTVTVTITDSYPNMIEYILPEYPELLTAAQEAIRDAGYTPKEDPIRGGTDGARFSQMGLPCPNLSCGAYYCHGAHEFASVQKMDQAVSIVKGIAKRLAGKETI